MSTDMNTYVDYINSMSGNILLGCDGFVDETYEIVQERQNQTEFSAIENLKDFWKYEFAKAGDYQKVKMISPITNKIGRFLFSPTAKRILEQEKSTINFEEIMNAGKILLCNLSKGKLGEDNSKVFGVVVMAKLQLASLRRARMAEKDRKDFYLYVDEFQNFATDTF